MIKPVASSTSKEFGVSGEIKSSRKLKKVKDPIYVCLHLWGDINKKRLRKHSII
jgi:hypothetical protein